MNGKRVWWRCAAAGHEWRSQVANRSTGSGCPACAGQTVITGVNDLASRQPSTARSWHPTRNAPTTPETVAVYPNRMWWLCPEGHEWESRVNNRSHGQGCPACVEGGGFNPGRPGYVYFLEHTELGAFKVGITNIGTTRLGDFNATDGRSSTSSCSLTASRLSPWKPPSNAGGATALVCALGSATLTCGTPAAGQRPSPTTRSLPSAASAESETSVACSSAHPCRGTGDPPSRTCRATRMTT